MMKNYCEYCHSYTFDEEIRGNCSACGAGRSEKEHLSNSSRLTPDCSSITDKVVYIASNTCATAGEITINVINVIGKTEEISVGII